MTEDLIQAALAVNKARKAMVTEARKADRSKKIDLSLGAVVAVPGGEATIIGVYDEEGVTKYRLSKLPSHWKEEAMGLPGAEFSTTAEALLKWKNERYNIKLAQLKEEAAALKAGQLLDGY